MIGVYITCANKKEASRISRLLLGKRLVGCTNIFPVESMFWWKGKISARNEFVIIAKSVEKKYNGIVSEVKKIHSYEIPCIIGIPEKANREYLEWIKGEVR